MTITKLSQCKSIDDFKKISKNLEISKSQGRSFCIGKRTYSMNQIVDQFDKCRKHSRDNNDPELNGKVNEELDRIDQLNLDANQRKKTVCLTLRKYFGNTWYRLTHFGKEKNSTLAKIRNAYPKNLVSTSFKEKVQLKDKEEAIIAKYGILGVEQWKDLGLDIGEGLPLPKDIEEYLEGDCEFYEEKKRKETRIVFLRPDSLNGNPTTLISLGKALQHKDFQRNLVNFISCGDATIHRHGFFFAPDNIKNAIGDISVKSAWISMLKEPLNMTNNETNFEPDFHRPPFVLEALIGTLAHYLKNGSSVFPNDVQKRDIFTLTGVERHLNFEKPVFSTNCHEKIEGKPIFLHCIDSRKQDFKKASKATITHHPEKPNSLSLVHEFD